MFQIQYSKELFWIKPTLFWTYDRESLDIQLGMDNRMIFVGILQGLPRTTTVVPEDFVSKNLFE